MKNLLSFFLFLISFTTKAQFYYSDILGTEELNQRMKNYTANKVLSVNAVPFNAEGTKTNDFIELQEIKENGKLLKVSSFNDNAKSTVYYRFDDNGKLINQVDSTNGAKSIFDFKYDNSGRLTSVLNRVSDADNTVTITESHQWFYNANGKPEKMLKIINSRDSTTYLFSPDERNNVADEVEIRRKTRYDSVLFYYDAQNRLSDIVRFNKKARKLLPDFMFEYDNDNRVIQKIATVSDTRIAYIIWRYQFNEKGLKTKEVLFNRYKQQTGRIEYRYTFGS